MSAIQTDLFGEPDEEMIRTAELSDDGRYRYMLGRSWAGGARVVFVMLNPSTADAMRDDPTVRRCIGFARSWGFGGLTIVNLYALRAVDPIDLWAADDSVGPENDRWLRWAVQGAGLIVGAWGAHARPDRVAAVRGMRGLDGLMALGTTKAGQPRHPLYVRGDTPLEPWPAERAS